MNFYALSHSNSTLKPNSVTPQRPRFGVNPQPPQYLLDRYGYDKASVILAATSPRNFRTETPRATIDLTYDEACQKLNDTFRLSPPLSKAQFAELQELNSPRHREKLEEAEKAAALASENHLDDTAPDPQSTPQKTTSPFHKAFSREKPANRPNESVEQHDDRGNIPETKTVRQTHRYPTRHNQA